MTKKIILLLAFIPTLLFAGYKDVLIKKNGEVVKCTITKEDSLNVYIDLKHDGVYISSIAPKSTLSEIVYDKNNKYKKGVEPNNESIVKVDSTDTLKDKVEHNDSLEKPIRHVKVELDFDPFAGNYESIFSFNELQIKYPINDRVSLRCGLELDYDGNSKNEDDFASDELKSNTESIKERSFLFGIKPGIEFKLLQNTKVIPYWGIELFLYNKISNSEYISYIRTNSSWDEEGIYEERKRVIKGAWGSSNEYSTSYTNQRAYYSFGANTFLGADYFITKNLYIGLEFGLGYRHLEYKKVEVEYSNNEEKDTYPSYRSSSLDFYSHSNFRLGLYF